MGLNNDAAQGFHEYGVSMNKSVGMTRVHGWHMRGPWMMRKRKKKPIGMGELVGLIRGPRKEVFHE